LFLFVVTNTFAFTLPSTPCGIAVGPASNFTNLLLFVLDLNIQNQTILNLGPSSISSMTYFNHPTSEFYVFSSDNALSVNVVSKVYTRFPMWKTPFLSNVGVAIGMKFLGYDNKGILYGTIPTSYNSGTYVVYASNREGQKWDTVTTFKIPDNIKSYYLQGSISGDKSSLIFVMWSSESANTGYFLVYNLMSGTWNDTLNIQSKLPFAPWQFTVLTNNQIFVSVTNKTSERIDYLSLSLSGKMEYYEFPDYFFTVLESDYPLVGGHLIIPGCDTSTHTTFNIRLFDTTTFQLAASWKIPIDSDLWMVCDYTWVSAGCPS